MALASGQLLSEVESWDDTQLVTVMQILDEQAEAMEAGRGR